MVVWECRWGAGLFSGVRSYNLAGGGMGVGYVAEMGGRGDWVRAYLLSVVRIYVFPDLPAGGRSGGREGVWTDVREGPYGGGRGALFG